MFSLGLFVDVGCLFCIELEFCEGRVLEMLVRLLFEEERGL